MTTVKSYISAFRSPIFPPPPSPPHLPHADFPATGLLSALISGSAPFWCTVVLFRGAGRRFRRGSLYGFRAVRNASQEACGLSRATRNPHHHRQSHWQIFRDSHPPPPHPPHASAP